MKKRLLRVVLSLVLFVFLPQDSAVGYHDQEYYYQLDPNNVVMEHFAMETPPEPWNDWTQWTQVDGGVNTIQHWSAIAGPLLQSTFDWLAGICATGNLPLGWTTLWWQTWHDDDTGLNHVLMYHANCEREWRPVQVTPDLIVGEAPLPAPAVADAFTTFCTGVDPAGLTAHIDLVSRDGRRGTIVSEISVNGNSEGFSVPAILPTGVPYDDAVEVWLDGMLLVRFNIGGNLWHNQQGVAEYLMGGCQHG